MLLEHQGNDFNRGFFRGTRAAFSMLVRWRSSTSAWVYLRAGKMTD
jgi:hypothetical protein